MSARFRSEDLYPARSARPWLHLCTTLVLGLGVSGAAFASMRDPSAVDAAFGAILFAAGSAVEWWTHREAMHERRRGLAGLFERHTAAHHGAYRPGAMSIGSLRELSIVLLKPWIVPAMAMICAPFCAAFALLGLRNFAAIALGVPVAYVLLYESIHLVCHLPDRPLLRAWPLRWLRRHHARHHDPGHMRSGNFNVAFPLWDLLRGTLMRPSDV